jgi:P4 family phage/plasmid primase-like protien
LAGWERGGFSQRNRDNAGRRSRFIWDFNGMREIDYTASVTFLSKLFALSEDLVELRAIPNDGGGVKARAFIGQGGAADLLRFCEVYDIPGVAVYFGCSTRKPGSRQGRKEDLSELVAAWLDVDCYKLGLSVDEVVAALNACACPPSRIVFSGGGVHAYWLLREALPASELDEHERVLKRLAEVFAGDPLPAQSAAVMRLVGTHNSKRDGWRECVVLAEHERLYELGDLAEMLDGLPVQLVPAGVAPAEKKAAAAADPFLDFAAIKRMDIEAELAEMRLHDPENKGMGVHRVRRDAAASLVARGHADEVIFDRLMAETERAYAEAGEPWSASRVRIERKKLRDEIASAHAKGWAPKPSNASRSEAANVVQLRPGAQPSPDAEPAEPAPALEFLGYPLNDLGNAMRMLKLFGNDIRYCLNVGWYRWDGRRFAFDAEGNRVRRHAQATAVHMRLAAAKLPGKTEAEQKANLTMFKFAISSGNKKGIDGMLSEIRTQIPVSPDDLDRDPMLLNCRNGTVDLRTGELRPHARDDLLSKVCGTDYDAEAACPRWERFVLEIFDGKTDLIDFVQRSLGYSLTGECREEVLFILHGSGANGKTVLIETMAAVLGDYVKHSPADAWTVSSQPQPSYDLAALVGARFVPVVETERNKQLAEARIKQATGGDKLPAMHKYKNPFEYQPQFKLWFATNHKPKIRGSDHAIWRRVYLIPFTVQFVDKEKADDEGGRRIKDPNLIVELKKELPGILAWMVRGCLEWQQWGSLRPPEMVTTATKDYQDSEDNISGFIGDCCNVRRSLKGEPFGRLYAAYLVWCEVDPEEPLEPTSKTAFGLGLSDRGLPIDRTGKERRRKGIEIKQPFEEKADERWEIEKANHQKPENGNETKGKA